MAISERYFHWQMEDPGIFNDNVWIELEQEEGMWVSILMHRR